jgi:hypothetical protein
MKDEETESEQDYRFGRGPVIKSKSYYGGMRPHELTRADRNGT